jgi:hypothetical protein
MKRTTTTSGKVVPEVASRGQTVRELIAELQRYPPEAAVVPGTAPGRRRRPPGYRTCC